jgi:hypothetical protein
MYNSKMPQGSELPSTAKLIKSTTAALAAACVILLTAVLPAEYGIDPTGAGRLLGLTRMGEIKMSLAREAAAEQAAAGSAEAAPRRTAPPAAAAAAPGAVRSDEIKVTLAPDQGAEVKVDLAKGARVSYEWASDGGRANYDLHGDSKALGIRYHGYSKGSEKRRAGELKAAFDGSHGWFWRNRTPQPITVTLSVNGEHTAIKRVE